MSQLPASTRSLFMDELTSWRTRRRPKQSPDSEREVAPAVTERRLRSLIAKVPITRVADLTPLDSLGLPVFSATTPLARDLTVHAGKGTTREAARVSAVMEAVERVSAEELDDGRAVRGSFHDLSRSRAMLDPSTCDLPPDSSYDHGRELSWVQGFDLMRDQPIWVPVDLAVSPPVEGALRAVDTNGLASGNGYTEAICHALCEVIERDAVSQLEYQLLFASPERLPARVRCATLPSSCRSWLPRFSAAGLQVAVFLLQNDIEVPTFACYVTAQREAAGAPPMSFPGFGTHPHAAIAVTRAISEAAQSRLAYLLGARDSFNSLPSGDRERTRLDRQRLLSAEEATDFDAIPSLTGSDLRDDLAHLLAALKPAGIERVVAVDLTRARLGIPVVRVRVPGLSCFLVNGDRPGWRCQRHLV